MSIIICNFQLSDCTYWTSKDYCGKVFRETMTEPQTKIPDICIVQWWFLLIILTEVTTY